jgi:two-component system, LytTR family, response regulator
MDTRSIKTVLIDDEEKSLKNLKRLLDLYCKEVKIVGDASDVESGMDIILETRPDLVFLDVEMSDGSGFHLLERLKECSFHVIFVTAHSHYAIKAFRFEATDYLLKPIDIDELIQAVKKVQQKEGGFERATWNSKRLKGSPWST